MWRNLFALIAGIFGMQIISTVVAIAAVKMYPPPPGFNPQDLAQLEAFTAGMPLTPKITIVAGWCLGAFAGAGLAARIAQSHQLWLTMAIGLLVAAATVQMAISIPSPDWMTLCGVFGPLLMAWIAWRLAIKPEVEVELFED